MQSHTPLRCLLRNRPRGNLGPICYTEGCSVDIPLVGGGNAMRAHPVAGSIKSPAAPNASNCGPCCHPRHGSECPFQMLSTSPLIIIYMTINKNHMRIINDQSLSNNQIYRYTTVNLYFECQQKKKNKKKITNTLIYIIIIRLHIQSC